MAIVLSYSRSGIGGKEGYWEELKANIDYVATIYGGKGKARFDGQLSSSEFLQALSPAMIVAIAQPSYLRWASMRAFMVEQVHLRSQSDCRLNELFSFVLLHHPTYGQAFVIGGMHGCGMEYGLYYFMAETALVSDLPHVLVFSEGKGDDYHPESAWLNRWVERLGVSIENPLPSPEDPLILDGYRTRGKSILDAASFKVIETFYYYPNSVLQERGPEIFSKLCEKIAPQFKVSPGSLYDFAYGILQRNERRENQQLYIQVSDAVARQVIRSKTKPQSVSLFMVGLNHFANIEATYRGK